MPRKKIDAEMPVAVAQPTAPAGESVSVAPVAQRSVPRSPMSMRTRRPKTSFEMLADWLTSLFGTMTFLIGNCLLFTFWIVWNIGLIPGLPIIDPFPFGFLTMAVSLEAIALSIIVLISQNRAAKVSNLREEIDFQVDLQSERQITAMVRSLDKIMHALNIDHNEHDSAKWPINLGRLEKKVISQIAKE